MNTSLVRAESPPQANDTPMPMTPNAHLLDAAFKTRLDALLPELIAVRRDLHAHPELGFQEVRTAQQIAEWLARLPGVGIRTGVAKTGVVATLAAERPGPCLAFRADMDALPLHDNCNQPHASQNQGVAHVCGHDGHVACLLGAAKLMAEMPERLAGPVRFLFQPAEEGEGGARLMIEEGALDNPRPVAIFGLHCWPALPCGVIGLRRGAIMAATDTIKIVVCGRGAHAAMPHRAADPIVAAAHIVTALQAVVARHADPLDPSVVTIGMFHAGTAHNIIPATAALKGTLRTLSQRQRETLRAAIARIATQTAAAFDTTAAVELEEGYPININDDALFDYVRRVGDATLGAARVRDDIPVSLGGEDFAFYSRLIPSLFWRLGVADANQPASAVPLHNSAFDFNDDALATGVAMHCATAWSWRGPAMFAEQFKM